MLSPTNYHIPTSVAERLAQYHRGVADFDEVISPEEIAATEQVLADITNPKANIVFCVGQVAGRTLLLIDDHARPAREFGILR